MKLIHLSDLHLGKRVNDFSMLEEQEAIIDKILGIIDNESPDAVMIAGDVYDKSVPSAEAVQLFDRFLLRLAERELSVFVISGNHDSPERIAFGSGIMNARKIYLSPVYNGAVTPITLTDSDGQVNFYMLPFIKPAHVRRFFENEEIVSYTDAVRVAVSAMNIDESERNVLITHQFVSGSERTESEEVSVGGTDNVDLDAISGFDYVALGHIHRAQSCGGDTVRYCGTPLKYSFSEINDEKSVSIIELGAKNEPPVIRTAPLTPIHEMSELRGKFSELYDPTFYSSTPKRADYLRIVLTDEDDVPDAIGRLRAVYPNLMTLSYDNARTAKNAIVPGDSEAETKSPYQIFSEFFELQNNAPMSDKQSKYIRSILEETEDRI